MRGAKEKAKELRAQFGDNAKYVVLEVMDELKLIGKESRLPYWWSVKIELEKI